MKIVYSYYVLDIVHTGHLLMMRNAKAIAGKDGKLIVGIIPDEAVMKEKKVRPILPFAERMELAAAIKYVDLVVTQATYSPLPNLRTIKPDILMESASHDKKELKKHEKFMKSIKGKIIVLPYYPAQSSTNIKNHIKKEFKSE